MFCGSQGLSPTYEQAHVSSDLLTLIAYFSHGYLCRRRHKVAIIAELNLKFSSRFLRQRDACGMEISVKRACAGMKAGVET